MVRVGVVLVLMFTLVGPAIAKSVPPHLASMAKELVTGSELDRATGDPEQDLLRRRAREILRKAGVRNWAQRPVVRADGATAIAESLGIDLSDPEQWAELNSVLGQIDRDAQISELKKLAKSRGKEISGKAFDALLTKFDEARAGTVEGMATSHVLEIGDNDDRVEIRWTPGSGKLEVRIKGGDTSEAKNDGFEVKLNGKVKTTPAEEGGDLELTVAPDEPPVSILPDEELDRLREKVFGKWRDQHARIWEFTGQTSEDARSRAEKTPRDEIAGLQKQLDAIKSEKIYKWKNPESGEEVRQDKFKRMPEPYEYLGQVYRKEDAEAEIARLEKQIEELTTANKILPVDQYDPVGLSGPKDETDSSQPLTIRVTDLEGYAFTYLSARLEAGRITAKRTLGDIRDIKGLPDDVVAQLIASWSPPEWIELEIKADPATKQVYITGIRWRLHVTYSSDSGHEVSRIHTPYESGLRLTQGDINVAEGAAEEEHL